MTRDEDWDEEQADDLIGMRVLIGLTHVGPAGEHTEQMFGTVTAVDAEDGIAIRLEGSREGELFQLPPHLDAFHPAAPGHYRLQGTQEIVIDPDYTTTWTINDARH